MPNKIELLSPAGNFECLVAAVQAGCDAVYLSGKNFGARSYAGNFDNDELLNEIIEITEYKILNYINKKTLPEELEFILIELVISRFNKIGSEGFSSESTDGKSISYEDDFENYKQYLDDYLFKTGQNKGFKLL